MNFSFENKNLGLIKENESLNKLLSALSKYQTHY